MGLGRPGAGHRDGSRLPDDGDARAGADATAPTLGSRAPARRPVLEPFLDRHAGAHVDDAGAPDADRFVRGGHRRPDAPLLAAAVRARVGPAPAGRLADAAPRRILR